MGLNPEDTLYMDSRTIFTVGDAKLDQIEVQLLHFITTWPNPTWVVQEIAIQTGIDIDDIETAIDMLVLHGLVENTPATPDMARLLSMPDAARAWVLEHYDELGDLVMMSNTDDMDAIEA